MTLKFCSGGCIRNNKAYESSLVENINDFMLVIRLLVWDMCCLLGDLVDNSRSADMQCCGMASISHYQTSRSPHAEKKYNTCIDCGKTKLSLWCYIFEKYTRSHTMSENHSSVIFQIPNHRHEANWCAHIYICKSNGACHPGGHHWDHYHGNLSYSSVTSTHSRGVRLCGFHPPFPSHWEKI